MEKEETQNLSLLQFLVMKGDGLLAFVRTFAKSWELLISSEDHLTSNYVTVPLGDRLEKKK